LVVAATTGEAGSDATFCDAKLITARFYAGHILPRANAYMRAATCESDLIMAMPEDSF